MGIILKFNKHSNKMHKFINTFFSRIWNKRKDKYSPQSLGNRGESVNSPRF